MGEEDDVKQMLQSPGLVYGHHQWTNMEEDDGEISTFSSSSSSSMEDSSLTCSSSSSDLYSSINSNGPLYELTELMAQLPIKRGLSKYYQGKSKSFTCVSSVKNIQQFAKNEGHRKRKMKKACKSYRLYTLPRPTISEKVSRNSRSCFASCRPSLFPAQTNSNSFKPNPIL